MSGIFGIYNRDGKPVNKEIVDTLLDGMSYWQPDDRGTWINSPVALGHTMLWNTPESKLEHLPCKQGHVVITMDARLDNCEELATQLAMEDRPLDQVTDSDFILQAYHKWGEECPKYLLGDFAFAIWDEKKQLLFCARDHVGVKQFYFHCTDTLFVCGNDLKGLTKHPDITKEINDEAVANFIVNALLKSPTLTFFKDIQKLSPAHTLTITSAHVQQHCYWRLEDAPKIQLSNAKAYAKKLRELLEQAVHDRMRSAYPITSHLSGGLDSSTIAVIAARKLREKGEKLLAFNWLHEPRADDDPDHYEWANSKTIAEAEDIDHHYVSLTAEDVYHYMSNRTIVYGDFATFWYEYPVREAVQNRGSRTILSGWGGDELVSYHGQAYYSDLFSQGKIIRAVKELKLRTIKDRNRSMRRMLSALYHNVFLIFVPRRAYCYMPKNRCIQKSSFPFVNKEFLPAIKEEMKKPCVLTMQPQRTIRAHMQAYWQNGHIQSRIESWATAAISNRLEYSYPLLDKRIIEFVLGVPVECFVRKGVGRCLFRTAAQGLLPEKIMWSDAKRELKRVERLVLLIFSSCKLIVANGKIKSERSNYIDTEELVESLEELEITCIDKKKLNEIREADISLSIILPSKID